MKLQIFTDKPVAYVLMWEWRPPD